MSEHDEKNVADLSREIGELKQAFEDHKALTEEQMKKTDELLDAWRAAGKALTFLKWISGIATAVVVFWTAVYNLFQAR